jgi:hypothetical protein
LKSYTCIGGTGGLAGLIRGAGAALAAAIASGEASSPFGADNAKAFLGAWGPPGLIVGSAGVLGAGGGLTTGVCTGSVICGS